LCALSFVLLKRESTAYDRDHPRTGRGGEL
jgi:hypothetical protein